MSTIRDEIKQSYLNEGGLQENLTNQSQTIAGIIKAKNNIAVNSISNVTVTPKKGTDTIYEHTVSDLQENVTIKDGKFFGTLKYVSEGALPTQWGAGHFLAIDVADENDTGATYKIGYYPSEGSGFVSITPPDDAAGLVTDPKTQKLYVFKTVNGAEHTQVFDLSGLTLEPAPAEE